MMSRSAARGDHHPADENDGSGTSRADTLRDLNALFAAGTVAGLADDQLLERFAAGCGLTAELAFAAIVARHGPMVLAACRRSLGDRHAAEDAFQATFLVLARRARSVRGATLAPWLHGVARRVALRSRADLRRRKIWEEKARPRADLDLSADPVASAAEAELRALIDEELAGLPAPYRDAILLCDLEGLSHEEAARHLGCPSGTIKSRQARGRERLKGRLARRGIAPAVFVAGLARVARPATLPPSLTTATIDAATRFAAGFGGAAASGAIPAAALATTTLRSMTMISLWKGAAPLITLGLGALAGGYLPAIQIPAGPGVPASVATTTLAEPAQDVATGTAPAAAPHVVTPAPAAAQAASAAPVRTRWAQVPTSDGDRLQSLEAKLDRLIQALERSPGGAVGSATNVPVDIHGRVAPPTAAYIPAPTPVSAPSLTPAPAVSVPAQSGVVTEVRNLAAPRAVATRAPRAQQGQATLPADHLAAVAADTHGPSVNDRLGAVERRLDQLEEKLKKVAAAVDGGVVRETRGATINSRTALRPPVEELPQTTLPAPAVVAPPVALPTNPGTIPPPLLEDNGSLLPN